MDWSVLLYLPFQGLALLVFYAEEVASISSRSSKLETLSLDTKIRRAVKRGPEEVGCAKFRWSNQKIGTLHRSTTAHAIEIKSHLNFGAHIPQFLMSFSQQIHRYLVAVKWPFPPVCLCGRLCNGVVNLLGSPSSITEPLKTKKICEYLPPSHLIGRLAKAYGCTKETQGNPEKCVFHALKDFSPSLKKYVKNVFSIYLQGSPIWITFPSKSSKLPRIPPQPT